MCCGSCHLCSRSELAVGEVINEGELQLAYEAGLWQLLDFFFLSYDDLDRGAFPEVRGGVRGCGRGQAEWGGWCWFRVGHTISGSTGARGLT
jgi:hypothetical protein